MKSNWHKVANGDGYSLSFDNETGNASITYNAKGEKTQAIINRKTLEEGEKKMNLVLLEYAYEDNTLHRVYISNIDFLKLRQGDYTCTLMTELFDKKRIEEKEATAEQEPGYVPGFVYVGYVDMNPSTGRYTKYVDVNGQGWLNNTPQVIEARSFYYEQKRRNITAKIDVENARHNEAIAKLKQELQELKAKNKAIDLSAYTQGTFPNEDIPQ